MVKMVKMVLASAFILIYIYRSYSLMAAKVPLLYLGVIYGYGTTLENI
jgi:hypothetical protein